MKNFKLTKNTKEIDGHILHQIKYTKYSRWHGKIGGWIEEEEILSQDDDCYIDCDSYLYGDTVIRGNVSIENSIINHSILALEDSDIIDCNISNSKIFLKSFNLDAFPNMDIIYSKINNSVINGEICIDSSFIRRSILKGEFILEDSYIDYTNLSILDTVKDDVCIRINNANITEDDEYLIFQGFGSNNRTTVAYLDRDEKIAVQCGCFKGNIVEFRNEIINTHRDNLYGLEYLKILDAIKAHFDIV